MYHARQSELSSGDNAVLQEILAALRSIQKENAQLAAAVDAINDRVDILAGKQMQDGATAGRSGSVTAEKQPPAYQSLDPSSNTRIASVNTVVPEVQADVDPLPMNWGANNAAQRGPVVVSRNNSTILRRNAIGAHGGSYSAYYALAVAGRDINIDHRPDFTNCEPVANIGPFPAWSDPKKIVSMDPLGHLAPWLYKDIIREDNVEIRPTIAITRAHMRLPELKESVREGRLVPDGQICLNELGELAVTKIAVEPVWYLPGIAERLGIEEGTLRKSLFEHTGGMYPELITRADIKVFLPPIGGLTVHCFGDPAKMSDVSVRLALRVHDECNSSNASWIFGIEEAVKEAQTGGSGVVISFQKEGRALGEVIKYLIHNAEERNADQGSEYFKRAEVIDDCVKGVCFQALMPDILHWLGITKIDRMLSTSGIEYESIAGQGIQVHERIPIPDGMIPEDSRGEIDAKVHAV